MKTCFLLLSLVVVALASPVAEKAEQKRMMGGGMVGDFLRGVEGAVNSVAAGAEGMVYDAAQGFMGGAPVGYPQQAVYVQGDLPFSSVDVLTFNQRGFVVQHQRLHNEGK